MVTFPGAGQAAAPVLLMHETAVQIKPVTLESFRTVLLAADGPALVTTTS